MWSTTSNGLSLCQHLLSLFFLHFFPGLSVRLSAYCVSVCVSVSVSGNGILVGVCVATLCSNRNVVQELEPRGFNPTPFMWPSEAASKSSTVLSFPRCLHLLRN